MNKYIVSFRSKEHDIWTGEEYVAARNSSEAQRIAKDGRATSPYEYVEFVALEISVNDKCPSLT